MLRKKRVTITEAAQAAIATGIPVDQALAEHGTVVPEAAAPEIAPAAEGTPVPVADPVEGTPAVAEPAADGTPAPVAEPAAEATPVITEAEPQADTTLALLDRLQAVQGTSAEQAAEITQLKADSELLGANQVGLMAVAVAATNKMQIALGGAATDLSNLSAENLLAQYQSTLATFEKRLPVGGKAEIPVDDADRHGKVVPLVSPGVVRATQIRK
jgi:hypothetical protein